MFLLCIHLLAQPRPPLLARSRRLHCLLPLAHVLSLQYFPHPPALTEPLKEHAAQYFCRCLRLSLCHCHLLFLGHLCHQRFPTAPFFLVCQTFPKACFPKSPVVLHFHSFLPLDFPLLHPCSWPSHVCPPLLRPPLLRPPLRSAVHLHLFHFLNTLLHPHAPSHRLHPPHLLRPQSSSVRFALLCPGTGQGRIWC